MTLKLIQGVPPGPVHRRDHHGSKGGGGSTSVAPRHRATLWSHALSAAAAGRLVFVQIDAISTTHARELFEAAVERSVEAQLVGVVWQELARKPETGGRVARYDFTSGVLDQ